LNLLRTVSQRLGRQLTQNELDALRYEQLPKKFSCGLPVLQSENEREEHAALRASLLSQV
jgi:hypothetical protein